MTRLDKHMLVREMSECWLECNNVLQQTFEATRKIYGMGVARPRRPARPRIDLLLEIEALKESLGIVY